MSLHLVATVLLLAEPAPPAAATPGAAPAPVAPAPVSASPGLAALLDAVIEAYGGRESIAGAGSLQQAGSVTSPLHPGARGRIERSYSRPGRLRVVRRLPGVPDELRVIDGGRGWRNGEPVTGPRHAAMVLQAARLDLPMLLDARRTKVVDRGEVELDGRTLRVLALELGEGLVVEAHVDPATGRILRSRGQGPAGAPLEFLTTYSDFRKVGGVLFAFREVNWANGVATGETILEEIRLGPAPAEATFSF